MAHFATSCMKFWLRSPHILREQIQIQNKYMIPNWKLLRAQRRCEMCIGLLCYQSWRAKKKEQIQEVDQIQYLKAETMKYTGWKSIVMPIQNDQRVFFLLLPYNQGPIAICGIQRVGIGFELLTIGFDMGRAQITRLILSFATTFFFYFFLCSNDG